jgi:hypothetical protein
MGSGHHFGWKPSGRESVLLLYSILYMNRCVPNMIECTSFYTVLLCCSLNPSWSIAMLIR